MGSTLISYNRDFTAGNFNVNSRKLNFYLELHAVPDILEDMTYIRERHIAT